MIIHRKWVVEKMPSEEEEKDLRKTLKEELEKIKAPFLKRVKNNRATKADCELFRSMGKMIIEYQESLDEEEK